MQNATYRRQHIGGLGAQTPPLESHARPYLRIPEKLLRSYAHDPLAIGVYLAVARCAVTARGAVPLSPADLAAWSYGDRTGDAALMRRIQKLVATGWLLATRSGTAKLRLLPTWGQSTQGTSQVWAFSDADLGKPGAVRTRRVPLALFDTYLGRCDPQPGRTPALLTRYFDHPLIDLRDVGVYVLATLTEVAPTKRLLAIGLFKGAEPQPPKPVEVLLAEAAEQQLVICDEQSLIRAAPSRQGHHRLGRTTAVPAERTPARDPIGSVIGSAIGSVIGSPEARRQRQVTGTPGAGKQLLTTGGTDGTWDTRNHGNRIDPPTMVGMDSGGGLVSPGHAARGHAQTEAINEQRLRVLRAIGIRHCAGLASVPFALLEQWAAAISHPGFLARFNDPAAFAYSQLRAGNAPPTYVELERWASPMGGREAFADRHYQPASADNLAEEQARLDHALAIAGSDNALLVSYVSEGLEHGLDDAAALVYAHAMAAELGARRGVGYA